MKAFLFEQTLLDVTGAAKYGDIITVFDHDDNRPKVFAPGFAPVAVNRMRDKGFDADRDYVICTGHLAPMALIIAEIVARYGVINLLLYERSTNTYIPRRLGAGNATVRS